MQTIQPPTDYTSLFQSIHTIAIVGLSPKEHRPSNIVARYLIGAGFTILPVNPGQRVILDQPTYACLADIKVPVDIVNIFRKSDEVYPFVEGAVTIGAKIVWLQQGIVNHEAAAYAKKHGLTVVMDRCIKVEHAASFDADK